MFPRYGSYPGFNPIVELSMTFHTQVVGANGQRQAMFIERMPGLAEVILSNFTFGPSDVMIVFSASGLSAVPVEMARGARQRGLRVIAVTSVAQSMSREPDPRVGSRLLDEADLVIDLCTPHADALVAIDGPGHAGRPGLDDRGRRHRQLPSRCGPPSSSWSAGRCRRSSPEPRSWAPSARGRCSKKPIESMRGASLVPSSSKDGGRARSEEVNRVSERGPSSRGDVVGRTVSGPWRIEEDNE